MGQPPRVPAGLDFMPEQVLKRLKNLKKKNSHVEGDPLPDLVRKMPELFASPVTAIFNKASASAEWPTSWKAEHITVIPKVKCPLSLAKTRNISCTALLSKVLEGALLEQLRRELAPNPNQYGGLKACGAEHMLVNVWDASLRAMDNGKDAVVLLGVDFQKAFNRMEYTACLGQLERLGASQGSLAMVHSFLKGRKMKLRLGTQTSSAVDILRGSPQGSVMGCALYCATTQSLEQPPASGIIAPRRPLGHPRDRLKPTKLGIRREMSQTFLRGSFSRGGKSASSTHPLYRTTQSYPHRMQTRPEVSLPLNLMVLVRVLSEV